MRRIIAVLVKYIRSFIKLIAGIFKKERQLPGKYVVDMMDRVRHVSSLFKSLRAKHKLPLRQPILDFAFGGDFINKGVYIDKDFIYLLAEDINVYNQGYDFSDKNFYYGMETVKPEGKGWEILEQDGIWVAIQTELPSWLEEIGEERKRQRQLIANKKKKQNEAKAYLKERWEENEEIIPTVDTKNNKPIKHTYASSYNSL